MANWYVNSTGANPAATPTANYDTWEKASATIGVVDGLAAAGDTIYVHPSHAEANGGGINCANGTISSPVRIVCGTPDTALAPASVGITALQTTATYGFTSAGTPTIQGFSYIRGVSFRITGSTSGVLPVINSVANGVITLDDCELYVTNTSAGSMFTVGPTLDGDSLTVFSTVRIRFGNASQQVKIYGRVIMNNVSFISGTTSQSNAGIFTVGLTAANGGVFDIHGLNCTNLGTAFNLFSEAAKGTVIGRAHNVQLPAGWAGDVNAAPDVGNVFALLNYSIGTDDTNYRFWTKDKLGEAKEAISGTASPVLTAGTGDGIFNYSVRLASNANAGFPSSVYRSPPFRKRVTADGAAHTISLPFCINGAAYPTLQDMWAEVEFQGTNGSAVSTVQSGFQIYPDPASTSYSDSGDAWTNASGAGPNESGNTTWNTARFQISGPTIHETGWVVVTVCIAKPSTTLFAHHELTVT